MTKNNLSAFHWKEQPSQIDWSRFKTERQILLDATRVNKPLDVAYAQQQTNSERAPR